MVSDRGGYHGTAAVNAQFVWRMEDGLDLYAEDFKPCQPVICFDERPCQLVADVFEPLPRKVGRAKRVDYQYERHCVCNAFMLFQPLAGWREVKVTERRTKLDFAEVMPELVDVHFPHAVKIRVVLDNLNTHSPAALYEAFAPQEARRLLQKLEFHYTPKHASWLNMASRSWLGNAFDGVFLTKTLCARNWQLTCNNVI